MFFIAEEVTCQRRLLKVMNIGLNYSANVTAKPYRFMFRNQMVDLFTGFLLPSTAKYFFWGKKKILVSPPPQY